MIACSLLGIYLSHNFTLKGFWKPPMILSVDAFHSRIIFNLIFVFYTWSRISPTSKNVWRVEQFGFVNQLFAIIFRYLWHGISGHFGDCVTEPETLPHGLQVRTGCDRGGVIWHVTRVASVRCHLVTRVQWDWHCGHFRQVGRSAPSLTLQLGDCLMWEAQSLTIQLNLPGREVNNKD